MYFSLYILFFHFINVFFHYILSLFFQRYSFIIYIGEKNERLLHPEQLKQSNPNKHIPPSLAVLSHKLNKVIFLEIGGEIV